MSEAERLMALVAEETFAATVRAEGGTYPAVLPAGVTPMSWHEMVKPDTDLPARGEGMAMVGLYYGCDHFAKIRVQDREEVHVRGHKKVHKRERAFIVHALGWKGESK